MALIKKVWEVSCDIWDHRNAVQLKTTTPAKLRWMAALDALIDDEYSRGTLGLTVRDQHWLSKPKVRIQKYDYERKEQWVESIQLARIRFHNRGEHEAACNCQQKDLLGDWLVHPATKPPN
jgi:hypothetical protein